MYFASKGLSDNKECYLIYDIRVARALVKMTCPAEIYEIIEVMPSDKFSHYKKYNEMLYRIASENDIEADALEMFLFEYDKYTEFEFK